LEPHLLIVDDDPMMLRAISRLLRNLPFRLVTATNAAEALLVQPPPEVVVCDGLEGEWLMVADRWQGTAFLLYSGSVVQCEKATLLGYNWVQKPDFKGLLHWLGAPP